MNDGMVVNEWTGMKGRIGALFLASPLRRLLEKTRMGDCSAVLKREIIDRLAGRGEVLDVGAGSGYFSLQIAAALPRGKVHCLDGSAEMLAHLARRVRRRGLAGIVNAIRGDASSSGLAGSSMDAVVSFLLLHELTDPGAVIGEMARVLKPGGRIMVGDFALAPSHHHPGSHGGWEVDELTAMLTGRGIIVLESGRLKELVYAVGIKG